MMVGQGGPRFGPTRPFSPEPYYHARMYESAHIDYDISIMHWKTIIYTNIQLD